MFGHLFRAPPPNRQCLPLQLLFLLAPLELLFLFAPPALQERALVHEPRKAKGMRLRQCHIFSSDNASMHNGRNLYKVSIQSKCTDKVLGFKDWSCMRIRIEQMQIMLAYNMFLR